MHIMFTYLPSLLLTLELFTKNCHLRVPDQTLRIVGVLMQALSL